MAFDYFHGVYNVERRRDPKRVWDPNRSSARRWIGWDDETRVLYLVPTNSSLRSPGTITGSSREEAIPADSIRDIWRVPPRVLSLYDALEIQVQEADEDCPEWYRISERKRQGRLNDVIAALREGWHGWRPVEPDDDEDEYYEDEGWLPDDFED